MDRIHYQEMEENLAKLAEEGALKDKKIYLFGHCNATEQLADLLFQRGYAVSAILDNNRAKHGRAYGGIRIIPPRDILKEQEESIVCIAARAYAAMADQLKRIGYQGCTRKVADYNSFADYSLAEDTRDRMNLRVRRGMERLQHLHRKYPDRLLILCPFLALGDIYLMMSYLPFYLEQRQTECALCVTGSSCADVVRMFGPYPVELLSQKQVDETIQAALYMRDMWTFIPHQDRPYTINLHQALYVKKIPLKQIYCSGIFGLPKDTKAVQPQYLKDYPGLEQIPAGKAVVLSPYAKSVTALPDAVWEQIIRDYTSKGYRCYTNVTGDETALEGTEAISPSVLEIRSVVERAGIFIGIRNGLCDVLELAEAEKTVLYPDYNYCDTNWKAIDIYPMEGWKHIVVKEGFTWNRR